MKRVFCFCLIICAVCTLFYGCAEEESAGSAGTFSTQSVLDSQPEQKPQETESTVSQQEQTENTLKQYEDLYETNYRISDAFVPQKVWLIGEKSLVEVFALKGVNNATVVEKKNIQRVEHKAVATFTTVTVYDKTGNSLTLSVENEKATEVLGMLQG